MKFSGIATLACSTSVFLFAASAFAQATPTTTIQAGFAPDPVVVPGMAGGGLQASSIQRGCNGFVSTRPTHLLRVTTPVPFLRVWSHAQQDTTLMVRLPSRQVVCADNVFGVDPSIDIASLRPGTYEIYVGSAAAGQPVGHQLGISASNTFRPPGATATPRAGGQSGATQITNVVVQVVPVINFAAAPPQVMAAGMTGGPSAVAPAVVPPNAVRLTTGFLPDPMEFAGVTSGQVAASSLSPQCEGFVGPHPDHSLVLNTPLSFLRIYARSVGDTTLAIRAPNGQIYCSDDVWGLNPGLDLANVPAGLYQIYVGSSLAGQTYGYQLGVSEAQTSAP